MITPAGSVRQRIRERNKYCPSPEAERPIIEGTKQTSKLPGDVVIVGDRVWVI